MSGVFSKTGFLLLVSVCISLASLTCAAEVRSARKRAVKQEQPAPAPQAVVPPAPLTLEQQPASPPQVDFQNGRLTIIAQNSTLGDVLRAVRSETGATVEIPANATERVVGHIGPGPAREVLASLLNGSHFDYVILGSPTNPGALDRVILLPKSTGEAATNLASQPNPGNQVYAQPQQQA